MKKWIVWGIVALAALFLLGSCGTYNSLVNKDEEIGRAMATIQTQEQRRLDLIPNLMAIVEGAAEFERGTLVEVTEARAQMSQALQINPEQLASDPVYRAQLLEAQEAMSGALSRLLVVVERYPHLTATEGFRDFQAQLEGTENRIQVARMDAQEAVRDYNTARRQIPFGVMVADMGDFEERPYYDADAGASEAPVISFE